MVTFNFQFLRNDRDVVPDSFVKLWNTKKFYFALHVRRTVKRKPQAYKRLQILYEHEQHRFHYIKKIGGKFYELPGE